MRTAIAIGLASVLAIGCSNSANGVGNPAGTGGVTGAPLTGGSPSEGTGGSGTVSPNEVQSLAVLAEDGQVVLTWTDPPDPVVSSHVEVTTLGFPETMTVARGVGTATVTGLSNRTQYTFLVRTVDASGNKSAGLAISARADFVKVEGGTFQQGTTDSSIQPSYPAHPVTLSSYYLGKYEVTFEEYDEFTDVTGRPMAWDRDWGRGTRPALSVSWFSAVAYANWRSRREGLEPVYTIDEQTPDPHNVAGEAINYTVTANWEANGYRLPTEAEWEFAADGGNLSHGYKFSGADSMVDIAWTNLDKAQGINGAASTHPVGTKAPNELGIYDLTGNVNEFAWDPVLSTRGNNYTADAQTNPKGPEGDYDRRVVRGGGPHSQEKCSMNVIRHFMRAPAQECMIGIRLARSVKGAGQ